VKVYLGDWSEWYGGLAIYNMGNDEAVLSGEIVGQAALRSVLPKAREPGMSAVPCFGPDDQDPGGTTRKGKQSARTVFEDRPVG
jgi:hypothetical protein